MKFLSGTNTVIEQGVLAYVETIQQIIHSTGDLTMKINHLNKILLISGLLSAGGVYAAGLMPGGEEEKGSEAHFQQLDTNQDGRLTQQEVAQNPEISRAFSDLDENGDGQLSAEEFSKYPEIKEESK